MTMALLNRACVCVLFALAVTAAVTKDDAALVPNAPVAPATETVKVAATTESSPPSAVDTKASSTNARPSESKSSVEAKTVISNSNSGTQNDGAVSSTKIEQSANQKTEKAEASMPTEKTATVTTASTAKASEKSVSTVDTQATNKAQDLATSPPSGASGASGTATANVDTKKSTESVQKSETSTVVAIAATAPAPDTKAKSESSTATATTTTTKSTTDALAMNDQASKTISHSLKATDAARMNLKEKLDKIMEDSLSHHTDMKLESKTSSGTSATAIQKTRVRKNRKMSITWYSDNKCEGEVKSSSVLDSTMMCAYLPGYGIPVVKSAKIECSQSLARGIATFYDTTCESYSAGRTLTVTLSDTNCIAFPGTDYYAKADWCKEFDSGASSVLPSTLSLLALLAAFTHLTSLWRF